MAYSYAAEYFYQVKKRKQAFPIAQVVGRTYFALFPVAGYLAVGGPDATALLYFLFFYPRTLAHLAVNDMADIANNRARGLATIPVIYGMAGAARWVLGFSLVHAVLAAVFAATLGTVAAAGFTVGLVLLAAANARFLRQKSDDAAMRALPLVHALLLVSVVAIIAEAVL
ncbi:UbiA family prenyltransferase [Methanoculleus frigidifontis]|uniref:UbiA family prenyltransferase n=1 Tax=Methanoculleus frigidifontis TaxID=2584085 RepID=UPI002659504E|nr:UbiA family prenyltransferase [Methanoculleus sp. FWC-SCC1]